MGDRRVVAEVPLSGKVVTIPVGDDLVLAQALAASLDEEQIEAELVLSSDPYVGLDHSSPHRLMIHERDLAAARPIIEAHVEAATSKAPLRTRGVRDIAGFVLLASVALGPVVGIVVMVRELLG